MSKTKDIAVYAVGLVYCSVCAPEEATGEEVAQAANLQYPTGVTPWAVADEDFRTGEPNPHSCEDAEGRRHWLLVC